MDLHEIVRVIPPRSLTMVGSCRRIMDVETSEAIEKLGIRIAALEQSLRAEMRGLFAESRRETDERFGEARRHTQVLYESLRDDIRMVAEGVATIAAKLDR